ncbi:MAG: hypothetical protein LQ351_005042 [Letrouitia transgressa]|nr:MAG: hypothetical protein LQ351_005042 [Letrouitia transgressa]
MATDSHDSIHATIFQTSFTAPRRRHSAFTELDVDGLEPTATSFTDNDQYDTDTELAEDSIAPQSSRLTTLPRLFLLTLLLVVAIPFLYDTQLLGKPGTSAIGAEAGVIRDRKNKRADTDTDVCTRFSGQSALVNGTIYLYGGHATTESGQRDNQWTNDFFTVDLSKSWDISSPVVKGLPQPSGPPAVANGYLWNSYDSLFLYGGIFQDTPAVEPGPYSLWEYQIKDSKWVEHKSPKTSAGNNSEDANQPVQSAGEGAGISIPELGRGYFFAGHLDHFTTPGWSIQTARLYLKALLEFTFPGYTNNAVDDLKGGKQADADGAFRNITRGGIQDTAKFPNRADGALVYVPGFGADGILLSIGGGTNESFSQMNVIDVFDIASSTWYKQSTSGKYPSLRVNPCAVAASAPDGSSTNIHVYGGQNLIPYGQQIQYDDMWILSVPSFTWIEVDTDGQSVPPARVGHSCNIWDGQIVVVGGYTGPDLSCETGFYIFSATNLTWQNKFNALSGGNPQNQQIAQEKDPQGLSGSYGYQVPIAVQKVIGGNANGGATITAPAQAATQGPFATGKPVTYTITDSNGAVVTQTGTATVINSGNNKGGGGPNIAAIIAGVVAGFFAVLAVYLGFCIWVYRRQLALYKNHVAMSQRAAIGGPNEKSGFLASSLEGSSALRTESTDRSSGAGATSSRATGANSNTGRSGHNSDMPPLPPGVFPPVGGNSTTNSSSEDLMTGAEPTFVGVLMNPRRSLRVINRD